MRSEAVTLKKTADLLEKASGDEIGVASAENIATIADLASTIEKSAEQLRERKSELAPMVKQLKDRRREIKELKRSVDRGDESTQIASLEKERNTCEQRLKDQEQINETLKIKTKMFSDLIEGFDQEK